MGQFRQISLIMIMVMSHVLLWGQVWPLDSVQKLWDTRARMKPIEGIYVILNGEEKKDNYDFMAVIDYMNSLQLVVFEGEDHEPFTLGNLIKLTPCQYASTWKNPEKGHLLNVNISFDEDYSEFTVSGLNNYRFIKIYPRDAVDEEAASGPDEIRIYPTESGLYELPVILNDVLVTYLLIDTGASETQIAPDVALTLIRSKTIDEDDWLEGRYYTFADGSQAYSERFILRSLVIGGHQLTDIAVSISGSLDAPMLLGQNVLKRFRNISIDYQQDKLIIR